MEEGDGMKKLDEVFYRGFPLECQSIEQFHGDRELKKNME